jgi:hypothetical protein
LWINAVNSTTIGRPSVLVIQFDAANFTGVGAEIKGHKLIFSHETLDASGSIKMKVSIVGIGGALDDAEICAMSSFSIVVFDLLDNLFIFCLAVGTNCVTPLGLPIAHIVAIE